MAKSFSFLSVIVSGIIICSFSGFGCKKAEQAGSSVGQQTKPSPGIVVQEYTFESEPGKWWPTGDIKYTKAADIKHNGTASLLVSGTAPVGMWNYIQSSDFNLEPGKKYFLSGWMLVKSISDTKFPPTLKCGANQNSRWLANFATNKYDINRKGEWQELSVEFTAPQEPNLKGYFSVEKGRNDEAIKAEIYIDDLRLEVRQ